MSKLNTGERKEDKPTTSHNNKHTVPHSLNTDLKTKTSKAFLDSLIQNLRGRLVKKNDGIWYEGIIKNVIIGGHDRFQLTLIHVQQITSYSSPSSSPVPFVPLPLPNPKHSPLPIPTSSHSPLPLPPPTASSSSSSVISHNPLPLPSSSPPNTNESTLLLLNKSQSMPFFSEMHFAGGEFVQLKCSLPHDETSIKTDSQISSPSNLVGRKLQKWSPEDNDNSNNIDIDDSRSIGDLGDNKTNNLTGWDQFEANRKLGVKESNYSEELYTTSLDRNSEFYKKNIEFSRKIADDILNTSTTSKHVLEERNIEKPNPNDSIEDNEEENYSSASGPCPVPVRTITSPDPIRTHESTNIQTPKSNERSKESHILSKGHLTSKDFSPVAILTRKHSPIIRQNDTNESLKSLPVEPEQTNVMSPTNSHSSNTTTLSSPQSQSQSQSQTKSTSKETKLSPAEELKSAILKKLQKDNVTPFKKTSPNVIHPGPQIPHPFDMNQSMESLSFNTSAPEFFPSLPMQMEMHGQVIPGVTNVGPGPGIPGVGPMVGPGPGVTTINYDPSQPIYPPINMNMHSMPQIPPHGMNPVNFNLVHSQYPPHPLQNHPSFPPPPFPDYPLFPSSVPYEGYLMDNENELEDEETQPGVQQPRDPILPPGTSQNDLPNLSNTTNQTGNPHTRNTGNTNTIKGRYYPPTTKKVYQYTVPYPVKPNPKIKK